MSSLKRMRSNSIDAWDGVFSLTLSWSDTSAIINFLLSFHSSTRLHRIHNWGLLHCKRKDHGEPASAFGRRAPEPVSDNTLWFCWLDKTGSCSYHKACYSRRWWAFWWLQVSFSCSLHTKEHNLFCLPKERTYWCGAHLQLIAKYSTMEKNYSILVYIS